MSENSYTPEVARKTKQFEEIPGGRMRRRKEPIEQGSKYGTRHGPGEIAHYKGLEAKEQSDRKNLKEQLREGEEEYFYRHEIEGTDVLCQERMGADEASDREVAAFLQEEHDNPLLRRGLRKAVKTLEQQRRKEELVKKERGVSHLLTTLYKTVQENPDIPESELLAFADTEASVIGLTADKKDIIRQGLRRYGEKHAAVSRVVKGGQTPEQLFVRCFGNPPRGKVETVPGPMTIMFQCFNDRDYLHAMFWGARGDESKITEEEKRFAQSSGGVALDTVVDPNLHGTITLERAASNQRREEIEKERVRTLYHFETSLPFDRLVSHVSIAPQKRDAYSIHIVERDEEGKPTHIQFFEKREGDEEKCLLDLMRMPEDSGSRAGWRDMQDSKLTIRSQITRTVAASTDGANGVDITIDANGIGVKDYSTDGTVLRYTERVSEPVIADQERSKTIHDHEEQHQFNKLFTPNEDKRWRAYDDLFDGIAKKALDPRYGLSEEAVQRALAMRFLRYRRRELGIDSAARDEILAYYRDGRSPGDIFRILTVSGLYDYRNQQWYKEKIDKLPDKLSSFYREYYSRKWGRYQNKPQVPKTVTPDTTQPLIDEVFGKEYRDDLNTWTRVVWSLEHKGYNQGEILGLLYAHPVNEWAKLERRIPPK